MLMDLSVPDITKSETTQVMYGNENVTKFSVVGLSTIKHSLDVCGDSSMPAVIINSEPVRNAYHDVHCKGVRIRWITGIIDDNIIYCREVMKIAELRHLDGLKGGFVVDDEKHYVATAVPQEAEPVAQLIYSNVKAITQFQQYVFNTLWNKAIPARNRIREIEEGLKREFIETVQDPKEILMMIPKIVSSATDEILLIFPSTKSFTIYEKEGGIVDSLGKVLANGITIRILTNKDDNIIEDRLVNLKKEYPSNLQTNYLDKSLQNRLITTIVVDRELSLIIESKENEDEYQEKMKRVQQQEEEDNYDDTDLIGFATYSNSHSTVSSYATIFETLWVKSELNL